MTYLDEKNKYTDADKKFLVVAGQYGRTKPGQMARYYAALSEVQLKQYADAEKNLGQVVSGGDENLASLAKYQLAEVYQQENKGAQAVDISSNCRTSPAYSSQSRWPCWPSRTTTARPIPRRPRNSTIR